MRGRLEGGEASGRGGWTGCPACKGRGRLQGRPAAARGFSAIEMLIVIIMIGTLVGIAFPYLRSFADRERARRSIEAVRREVSITRSLAIRSGRPMALVANESNRVLVVRDTTGTEFRRLELDDDSDLKVLSLNLDVGGDSIVFGPAACASTATPCNRRRYG